MNQKTGIIIGAIVLMACFLFFGIRYQRKLSSNLPPKVVFDSREAALAGAAAFIADHAPDANYAITSGTPSMEPYIHGQNYVVIDPSVPYESIRADDCVAYVSHDAVQGIPDGTLVLHVVAQIDSGGFIMAGINNSASENKARVKKADYMGKLLLVAAWPQ